MWIETHRVDKHVEAHHVDDTSIPILYTFNCYEGPLLEYLHVENFCEVRETGILGTTRPSCETL